VQEIKEMIYGFSLEIGHLSLIGSIGNWTLVIFKETLDLSMYA